VSCDPVRPLVVRLDVIGGVNKFHRLVVDGQEATAPSQFGATHNSATQIVVAPAPLHTIMVTGDAAAYSLNAYAQ
jgi:hypothetical protein